MGKVSWRFLALLTCTILTIGIAIWRGAFGHPSAKLKSEIRYVVLDTVYGNLCNQLHTIGRAFDVARELNAIVRVTEPTFIQLFREGLDISLIQEHSPVEFQLVEPGGWYDPFVPEKSLGLNPAEAVVCGIRNAYPAIRTFIRPSPYLRHEGEDHIRLLREMGEDVRVMSVHLRHFEEVCADGKLQKPEWIAENTPCHRTSDFQVDASRICQTQLNKALMDRVHREWPQTKNETLAVFVSSDRQHPQYDKTFHAVENHLAHKLIGSRQSAENTSMLADMWSSVVSDYYVGNPASSCESIIAQWRAGKERPHTAPGRCFAGFQEAPSVSVFNKSACETYATTLFWRKAVT